MQHEFCCGNLIGRSWRSWKTNQVTPTYPISVMVGTMWALLVLWMLLTSLTILSVGSLLFNFSRFLVRVCGALRTIHVCANYYLLANLANVDG